MDDGTLDGVGSGASGHAELESFREKLVKAQGAIDAGDVATACDHLQTPLVRTDGLAPPPGWIEGPSAPDIAAAVQAVIDALGCP